MPMTEEQLDAELLAAEKRANEYAEKTQKERDREAGKRIGRMSGGRTELEEARSAMTERSPSLLQEQIPGTGPRTALNPEGLRPGELLARGATAADDIVRNVANSVTGGMGDQIATKATNAMQSLVRKTPGEEVEPATSLEAQMAKTLESRLRLGDGISRGADIAGVGLQGMLLPGKMVSTMPRAMATGGALAGGNTITNALGKGETPDTSDVIVATGVGSVAGALGKYVGTKFGDLIERKLGNDPNIYKQAQKSVQELKDSVANAGTAMRNANVVIDQKYITRRLDSFVKQLEKNKFYQIGQMPHAKAAIQTLRDLTSKGNVTLDELNTARRVVRDSILDKNGAWLDSVKDWDAKEIQKLGKYLSKTIGSLEVNPHVVVSGNAKAGVNAWKEMNKTEPMKAKADLLARAFDQADLNAGAGKTDFDRALQLEFKKLYNSKRGQAEFRGPEREMLRDLAKGGELTAALNRLDRKFGHGLFSMVYNTLRSVPRSASSNMAEQNARQIFQNLTKQSIPRPTTGPQAGVGIGAGVGTVSPEFMPELNLGNLIQPESPARQALKPIHQQ